jgi:hypothetical protein
LRLALSKGPNTVGATFILPEDGNRFSFRNVVFLRKHWTMDKDQKPDTFKYNRSFASVKDLTSISGFATDDGIVTVQTRVSFCKYPDALS